MIKKILNFRFHLGEWLLHLALRIYLNTTYINPNGDYHQWYTNIFHHSQFPGIPEDGYIVVTFELKKKEMVRAHPYFRRVELELPEGGEDV